MINVNYFNINDYEKINVNIDNIYYDITKALEDVGYMYYNTIENKKLKLFKHVYKKRGKYYIMSNVNYKNHFIRFIELADITDFINERWN